MLNWVFGKKSGKKTGKKRPPYDKAKEIAARGDVKARRELAAHEDLEPEILYFFATDNSPEVRRQVAVNTGTPLQADVLLARDIDDDVRCEVARKIGRLVPTLTADERDRLTTMALQVLEILAQDRLPQVRAIVAEELKMASNVPHHLIMRLARDIEEIVSAPVAEYSPLLSGEDLLEIIASGVGEGTLSALSRRQQLVDSVVTAVVGMNSKRAMKSLLENQGADIPEESLDAIAAVASGAKELHKPIVNRKNLSIRMIRRIASFVSASLVETLIERNSVAESVGSELRQAVRRRIDRDDFDDRESARDPADVRATEMFEAGTLNEESVIEAIDNGDRSFIRFALALMSGQPPENVIRMLNSGSGKTIAALAWKADLGMQTAEALQMKIAHLSSKSLVRAREGDAYPLTEDDLNWYLELFAT